ncbi:integrase, catalytic region, zinc finger, CCHC-type containing protein [Tanacetum coccineum]
MLTKPQVFYDDTHKQALGYQNPFYLKKAQRIKPTLYDDSVISSQHAIILVIDDEETLILEEVSRSKMLAKQNDPISKEKKINTTPVNYVELNRLSKDFGKHFVPQQESSAEQAFWLQTYNPNTDQSDISPVKIEAPRELPKKAQLQAKDTTICKLKEHIKSMRENNKEEKVKQEMDEIETINIELEHNVAKLLSENELLHKEIEHLKKIYKDQFDSIKKTRALSKEHCDSLIAQLNSKSMENADLKGQIQEKVFVTTTLQNELSKLKGKNVLDNATTITNATTIAPGLFKLDLDPLAPRLLKNRDAHIDYLKYTHEQANILWGIVEQAKAKQPLDNALYFSCKHAKRIQELLVYARDTCAHANKPSDKLVAITPMNKVKRVSSTSASRSQPTGNKKNNRISQTPSSNMKNKVEVQLRRSNLSSNKKNHVKDPICDANVKHTMLNANSELICVKCKQCMFDANHDACFLDFVNDVNVRSKSKSAKQSQQHNIWKPTGKVFTKVGYKWKPTRRLFTLVVETQKPEIKVYSRRPKQVKSVGSSKKAMFVESKIANNSEPNHSWGSNAIDVSSSSLVNDRLSRSFSGTIRFGNYQIAKIMGYGDYHLDLEVPFRKNTCFIWNLDGVDLLSESRDTNLYTISLDDMLKTSLICLLSKASKTKSWLWHCQLSHLNFGTLNKLVKDGLARGIPKLKFKKNNLCSACALGKSKKSSHQPKPEDTNQEKLYLLHMALCGLMRVERIYRKNYILNGVVERRNRTLVEAARTMLIFSKGPGLQLMTPATFSLGLVPNPILEQPFNPPTRNNWDRLFQPMFNEYFNTLSSAVSPVRVACAPRAIEIAATPSSTTIDQDAPSSSTSSTNQQEQSSIITYGV